MTLTSQVELHPRAAMWQYTDYWGTRVTSFDLQQPHDVLTIRASSTVETNRQVAASRSEGPRLAMPWADLAERTTTGDFTEYLARTDRTTISRELEQAVRDRTAGADPHEAADAIGALVTDSMAYVPGATGVQTNAQEAWDQKSGVCQDFSHLAIAMMRAIGLPARYVSGYLFPALDAEPGVSAEGQSHAWTEYWAGSWIGIDATNRASPGPRHILVGHGRDYGDVLPHKGIYHGAPARDLKVSVRCTRLA
jgi:transglutaminase-like putative cysteine protease